MRFGSGQCASVIGVASILLFRSGEEHHVGQMPEVQKEEGYPIRHGTESPWRALGPSTESRYSKENLWPNTNT